MSALIADTGGLLRALASNPDGKPAWPEFEKALTTASAVIIPVLVLAEVDYFLRDQRIAMRKLVAEILDPETTYEIEPFLANDLARAMELDMKFNNLKLGIVDSMVATVAERRRVYRILTTDHSDFAASRVGTNYHHPFILVP